MFSFVIQLPEFTKRIEDKRLVFALCFSAGGLEAWDNNRGENYQLPDGEEARLPVSEYPPTRLVKSADVDQMTNIRKALKRYLREDEESSGLRWSDVLSTKLRAKSIQIEDRKMSFSFASRCDFGGNSKVRREPPKEFPSYGGLPPAIPSPSVRSVHRRSYSTSGPSVNATRPHHRQRGGSFDPCTDGPHPRCLRLPQWGQRWRRLT